MDDYEEGIEVDESFYYANWRCSRCCQLNEGDGKYCSVCRHCGVKQAEKDE